MVIMSAAHTPVEIIFRYESKSSIFSEYIKIEILPDIVGWLKVYPYLSPYELGIRPPTYPTVFELPAS